MSEIFRNTTLTDSEKSRDQLLDELREMRQTIDELELIKSRHKTAEAKLQLMLFSIEHVAESAFWIGPDGHFIYVNEVACKTLGYSKDQFTRMKIHDILPDSSEEAWQELWEIIKRKNSIISEFVYCTSKGYSFPVELNLNYLVFEEKEYGFIVARDISERKEAEDKIKESERRFQDIVANTGDWIWEVDSEGRYTYASPAVEDMLGYKSDEMIGKYFYELFHPDDMENLKSDVSEAFTNKQALKSFINRNLHKNGDVVFLETSGVPVLDKEGNLIGYRGTDRNITDKVEYYRGLQRKQIALEEKHSQLNNLFKEVEISKKEWESTMDSVEDMVILADSHGAIKRFNRAFLEFTGMSRDEIVNKKWEDFIIEQDLKSISYYSGSIDLFHEPSKRWFQFKAYPFEDKDLDFSGAVIALHETTEIKNVTCELEKAYDELKSAQSQMLQREKMASIGQLAAGVAHEINNPMGFIKSNLSTLDKYIDKIKEFIKKQDKVILSLGKEAMVDQLHDEKEKLKLDYVLNDINQLINESLDGAERVNNIVQNLRGFSRIDESEYKAVDINESVECTINIVWNDLKYKAKVKKEYGELPQVNCFPHQLNQAFLNLLMNSVQAIESKGEIMIKTWFSEGNVNVSISDTGVGIAEDKIGKVFEPFFTTKPVGEGTGLGLSIAYDIIKKHNGNIIVESIPGEGTAFTVILPAF